MADFECRELEIGLKFGHLSFDKRKNFSEGSFKPTKYAQVIRVRGENYLFETIILQILLYLFI